MPRSRPPCQARRRHRPGLGGVKRGTKPFCTCEPPMCYSFVVTTGANRGGDIMKSLSLVIFAMALFSPVAASAQLNVMISGGFSGAYEQLLPEFERTSGIKVTTGSGASQGTGPQTIAAQLARGVPADVVILSREGLSELIAARRIVAGTDVDLARVALGVAVRAGTPKPDVST